MSDPENKLWVFGDDVDGRRRRLLLLHEVEFSKHRELFVAALADLDWRVRSEAIAAVSKATPTDEVVDTMIELIADTDTISLRNAALSVLATLNLFDVRKFEVAYSNVAPSRRPFVIQAFGQVGRVEAIPFLRRVVEGADANAAAAAIDSVVAIASIESIALLRMLLRSGNVFHQVAAVEGLARLQATVSWDEIKPLLQNSIARRVAVDLLGRVEHRDAVLLLVSLLYEPSKSIVASAVTALEEQLIRNPFLEPLVRAEISEEKDQSIRQVRSVLLDGDSSARQAAAHLFVLLQDGEALEGVVAVVGEGLATQETLTQLRSWGVGILPHLFSLRGASDSVWATAIELAAEIGHGYRQTLPREIELQLRDEIDLGLQASVEIVRLSAARSLHWWGREVHVVPLKNMILGDSKSLSLAASHVLATLAESFPDLVIQNLEDIDFDKESAEDVVPALERIGTSNAADLLRRGLDVRSISTRAACVRALANCDAQRHVEDLAFALMDEDPDVQLAATHSLGTLQGADVVQALLLAIDSPHPVVRASAIESLTRIEPVLLRSRLAALCEDSSSVVVAAAIRSLSVCDPTQIPSVVRQSIAHKDDEVVKAAIAVCRTLPVRERLEVLKSSLAHESWHVRIKAAEQLGADSGSEALAILEDRQSLEHDEMVADKISLILKENSR